MNMIATKIDFDPKEHKRIVSVGDKLASGIRVSFRSRCKRLIMQRVEQVENEKKGEVK